MESTQQQKDWSEQVGFQNASAEVPDVFDFKVLKVSWDLSWPRSLEYKLFFSPGLVAHVWSAVPLLPLVLMLHVFKLGLPNAAQLSVSKELNRSITQRASYLRTHCWEGEEKPGTRRDLSPWINRDVLYYSCWPMDERLGSNIRC